MKNNTWEILKANRSEYNESVGKDMAGCLADGEKVIAYFPTLSAMRQADLIAAAPEMLAALQAVAIGLSPASLKLQKDSLADLCRTCSEIIQEAIAKAEGNA
jgi:hypothetical protein